MKEPECPRCGYVATDNPLQRRTLLVVLIQGTREQVQVCDHCHRAGERIVRVGGRNG